MDKELVASALVMALWNCKPQYTVAIHSDQGNQFSNYEQQRFLKENLLKQGMSRSGNCQDNIVIEGFFLLQKEQIKP